MGVSEGHRELTAEEFATLCKEHGDVWSNPSVVAQQRALADTELARLRAGEDLPVFNVLQRLVAKLDVQPVSVLEVGCASGYYATVLRLGGWNGSYLGIDYSESLIACAREHHPDAEFTVADATDLGNIGKFDCVISGACIMHIRDWRKAIAELARVSRGPVILHRTPIAHGGHTRYWIKQAYGVPCCEQHFGEAEFLDGLRENGLRVVECRDIGDSGTFTMKAYLCAKE